jgi:hypothetical protein
MASREYGLHDFRTHNSKVLEPVEVDGRIYLTSDARHVGDLDRLGSGNDMGQFLELVDRISSRVPGEETEDFVHVPARRRRAMATRDVADVSDWL